MIGASRENVGLIKLNECPHATPHTSLRVACPLPAKRCRWVTWSGGKPKVGPLNDGGRGEEGVQRSTLAGWIPLNEPFDRVYVRHGCPGQPPPSVPHQPGSVGCRHSMIQKVYGIQRW